MSEIPQELKEKIENLIKSHKIILFMKGDKIYPKCGFSASVVEILNSYPIKYLSFDILEDEDLRQGLKVYSNWPTYPQLYVNGELVGGCDIITEMHEEKELDELFAQ